MSKLLMKNAGGSPPPSTIAYVGYTNGGYTGGATSLTYSHTTGSGSNRILIVGFTGDVTGGSDDVSSVTYAGNAMTFINKTDGVNNRWSYLYYILNPTTGANNVVITFSSSHWIQSGCVEYTGVQDIDANTTNESTISVTTLTTSVTTTVDNSWTVLFECGYSGGNDPTAGTGSTRRSGVTSFGAFGLFDSGGAITPAGSYSMTTNRSSSGYNISHNMVAIKPY